MGSGDPHRLRLHELQRRHPAGVRRHFENAGIEHVAPRLRVARRQFRQRHAPDTAKDVAHIRHRHLGLLDLGPGIDQQLCRLLDGGDPLPIHRRLKAGTAHHRHTQAGDTIFDAIEPVAWLVLQAERVTDVVARHRTQHDRGVAHRAGHRPGHGNR